MAADAATASGVNGALIGTRDAADRPGPGPVEAGPDDRDPSDSVRGGEKEQLQARDEAPPERRHGTLSEELAHLADLFARPVAETDETGAGEPAGIATLTLAEIYARQGLYGEAARVCERILERDPENERVKAALSDYRRRPAPVQR